MRAVEFHPDAQAEFISAARFYEHEREGLGLDFIAAVQHAYERLPECLNRPGPEAAAEEQRWGSLRHGSDQ